MTDLFDVNNLKVVITGGAGVLGGAIAEDLCARGARVCVLDYDAFRANDLCKKIEADGGFAIPVEASVLDKGQIQSAFSCANESLGGIDVLINAAGGNKKKATTNEDLSFFDLPADAIRDVFDLNLIGTLLPSQVFGREFARQKQGIILNVSSMNAFRPLTKIAAYSAAKAAVSNFTQWLAVHMAQNYSPQIRVNAIAPGFFLTEQNRFLLTDEQTGNLTPRGKQILDHTPMGRFGEPSDLSGAVMWLISEASRFVTGTVVAIDGGFSAYSGV